jgi:FG-GAP-like repeat/ASPIC and UnbV
MARFRRRRTHRLLALLLVAGGVATVSSWSITAQSQGVAWERARETVGRFRAMVDSSGLVEVGSNIPPNVRRDDLQSLCAGRQEAIVRARKKGEQDLRTLIPGDDPITAEQRGVIERYLGSVASFTGEADEAVRHFQAGRDAVAAMLPDAPGLKKVYLALVVSLGVGHMRQGEANNCLLTPNPDRCLFPLRPGGVHMHPEAAQAAVTRFQEYLQYEPDDLGVRWLLNLAYMLLGRYPQDVPPQYLLKPDLFKSEAPMPRFFDVGGPTKLGRTGNAGGTIVDDFDGDGRFDVFFTSVDYCSPVRLYRNRGDGTFEDRTEAAGLLTQLGGINAVQTDYNNDGRIDIFIMRGGWESAMRNSLLRNNPDGTFTDVTREAGLLDGKQATHSVAWGDYDNDGWLDVFVAHELSPSQLFRNRGDGTFEDVTARAGVGSTAFTKGVVFGDYDGNGYPDLYLSNMFGDNILYRNNGDGTFTEVGKKLGVEKPFASFPTWFFDYDNDGRLDIFVASYPNSVEEFVKYYLHLPPATETLKLYHNIGNGAFEEVSSRTNLARIVPAMGSNFGDLDNDGFLDMYLGTGTPSFGTLMPNIMLKNDEGRRFLDVTEATGTGNLQKGHGVAFVDIDNDGDEDVVLNSGGAVPGDRYEESLYENPGFTGRHWLSLHLIGSKSNRAAIGAKIKVTLPRSEGGSALRYREVTSGGSFGATTLTQHIGIGAATSVTRLEIDWPASRTHQVFTQVPVDAFLEIRESDDRITVLHRPTFKLAGPSSTSQ